MLIHFIGQGVDVNSCCYFPKNTTFWNVTLEINGWRCICFIETMIVTLIGSLDAEDWGTAFPKCQQLCTSVYGVTYKKTWNNKDHPACVQTWHVVIVMVIINDHLHLFCILRQTRSHLSSSSRTPHIRKPTIGGHCYNATMHCINCPRYALYTNWKFWAQNGFTEVTY